MLLIALLPLQKNAFAGGADPEPKFQGAQRFLFAERGGRRRRDVRVRRATASSNFTEVIG